MASWVRSSPNRQDPARGIAGGAADNNRQLPTPPQLPPPTALPPPPRINGDCMGAPAAAPPAGTAAVDAPPTAAAAATSATAPPGPASPSAGAVVPVSNTAAPQPPPAAAPPLLKAAPKPPQKSYLPTFIAPEAYGKKMGEHARIKKEVQEQVAKVFAAKERAKLQKKKKKAVSAPVVSQDDDDDDGLGWKTAFVIFLGIFTALAEALDLDVLLGILFMPFVKAMQWLAEKYQNVNLDPSVWMKHISDAYNELCRSHPAGFVMADFGLFTLFVLLFLFEADISKWWATRNLRAQGYEELDEGDEESGHGMSRFGELAKIINDPDAMLLMLRNAREELEELNLMVRLRGDDIEPAVEADLFARRAHIEEKIATLNGFLESVDTTKKVEDVEVDLEAAARKAAEAEAEKKKQGGCGEMTKLGVVILRNTISGVMTMYLYFMDLISDYQVTMLFYHAGAYRFALVSGSLIIGQFAVVWLRVLPYLYVTYGPASSFYRTFLYFGMPFGCFFLDVLMFLEPFGLLPITPMPETLRQFIPAYKSTRIIAEVLVEALPQCMMQAVIYVVVSIHVRDGTAGAVDMELARQNNGEFVSLMPKSILISSCTMLKTWFELVQEARQAGISVAKKGMQLWAVGHGLPLDAIKRNSIYAWKCQYEISDQEVVQLVDALGKNKSLTRLDLSLAGFEWLPPVQREERSAISSLLREMNANPKSLEALEKLVICPSASTQAAAGQPSLFGGMSVAFAGFASTETQEDLQKLFDEIDEDGSGTLEVDELQTLFTTKLSIRKSDDEIRQIFAEVKGPDATDYESVDVHEFKRVVDRIKAHDGEPSAPPPDEAEGRWEIPVGEIRGGPERALKALSKMDLMAKGGPQREEIHAMFELLCKNRSSEPGEGELNLSHSAVAKVFRDAQRESSNKKAKRQAWQKSVAGLMAKGMTRRSHFRVVVSAEVLRNVGFGAQELLDLGFSPQELKRGFFEARELRDIGFDAKALKELGYTPGELCKAEILARDMKQLGFSALQMRIGGYSAQQMKDSQSYALSELREGRYRAEELGRAGYHIADLRGARFTALDLRKALIFTVQMMREGGYTAVEMKQANYDAKRMNEAGYGAGEAIHAGYTVAQMFAGGYPAAGLRSAGYSAAALREVGYDLNALQGAFYTAVELEEAGYSTQELKQAGTSLVQLKAAGTSMATLKDAAYTAARLKQQGYTATELASQSRGRVDLTGLGPMYVPKECIWECSLSDDSGYTCKELRGGGVTAYELKRGRIFFRIEEWKDASWPTRELREGGYTCAELMLCGYKAAELHKHGYSFKELVEAGIPIAELRAIGITLSELRDVGFSAGQLREVGFSAKELLEAGFVAEELIECGFGVIDLVAAGFDAMQLRGLGFSVHELKQSGQSARALRDVLERFEKRLRGVVRELFELGYPDDELVEGAGFTQRAVEAINGSRTARQLKEDCVPPYEVAELREYGLNAGELRGIYTLTDLKANGYDLDELREGGVPEHAVLAVDGRSVDELRSAGYTAQVLRKVGYALYELTAGGYTSSELKEAGYGVFELKEAGFSASALREAEFTSKQLRAARYGLREMQEGGYDWKDLVIFLRATHAELTKAGYTDLDPKHPFFYLYREKEDADGEMAIADVSVLSPRHHETHRAASVSPRNRAFDTSLLTALATPGTGRSSSPRGLLGTPGRSTSPPLLSPRRFFQIGHRGAKVRQGVALTSKCVAVLKPGTRVRVVDSRVWRSDGTQRVRIVSAADDDGGAPQMLPLGWVTASYLVPDVGKAGPPEMYALSPMEC